jgi:hypothetical protein
MSKDKVLSLLPRLTQQELREISAVLENLLDKNIPTEMDELVQAITAATGILHGNLDKKGMVKHGKPVLEFLAKYFPGVVNKIPRQAVLRCFIKILIDYLDGIKVPVSGRSVVLNLDKIPGLFRIAFPGWLEGGRAYMVVEAMMKPADGQTSWE